MVPIYRTDGEWVAIFQQGHLFNVEGTWLGFAVGREIFDPNGNYIGFLSDDQRLLRTRTEPGRMPRYRPPEAPCRPAMPSRVRLAPMLRPLPYHMIDLFEEFPERFSYISESQPDME